MWKSLLALFAMLVPIAWSATACDQSITCDAACSHMAECGGDYMACIPDCLLRASQADIEAAYHMSCELIRARLDGSQAQQAQGSSSGGTPAFIPDGTPCVGGNYRCNALSICCSSRGGAAGYGESGTCMDAAICNMPRR